MRPFTYSKPQNEAAAIESATATDALLIAGGTGVVDLLRLGVMQPASLVDVSAMPWTRIELLPNDGGLRVGALVTNTDLAYDPYVRAKFPGLSEALLSGASPQLRNMATVAGNLLQRTRCSYFRDVAAFECNKRKPGSGCAAQNGVTRMHAILGGSDACIAAHPSDMCVALAALEAIVHVRGPRGERDIAIADLHTLPGEHPEIENSLAPGELVTSVTIPSTPMAQRSVYVKTRDRASFAFALASACVAIDAPDNVIHDVRVALGGVATKPWRSVEAEAVLKGQRVSSDLFRRAADAAMKDAKPRAGNAFKVELAKRTIIRALERVFA